VMDGDPVAEVRERPDDREPDASRPPGYQDSAVGHETRPYRAGLSRQRVNSA